jgi:hypothetical protein
MFDNERKEWKVSVTPLLGETSLIGKERMPDSPAYPVKMDIGSDPDLMTPTVLADDAMALSTLTYEK